jgi:hypothetical protein
MDSRHSGYSLVLSVGLWAPTARRALAGDIELIPALIRYLAALAVAWVAVAAVTRLTHSYRVVAAQQQLLAALPSPEPVAGASAARPPPETVVDAASVLDAVTELDEPTLVGGTGTER